MLSLLFACLSLDLIAVANGVMIQGWALHRHIRSCALFCSNFSIDVSHLHSNGSLSIASDLESRGVAFFHCVCRISSSSSYAIESCTHYSASTLCSRTFHQNGSAWNSWLTTIDPVTCSRFEIDQVVHSGLMVTGDPSRCVYDTTCMFKAHLLPSKRS